MKKKILSVMLAAGLVVTSLAACGGSDQAEAPATDEPAATEEPAAEEPAAEDIDYGSGEIKVWVADNVVDFTNEQLNNFKTENPQFAGWNFTIEAVGEGDAASNMITDVEAGADIYTFPQDQTARLISAGALEEVAPENVDAIKSNNDTSSVTAATVGDTLYAYPITSDNGYFLYYDKNVVSDPSTLEGVVADCEKAGKNFYFEINSGWYQPAFFFGAGCTLTYDTDNDGNFTACNIDYASDKGLVALKEIIELKASKAFQNGSSLGDATNVGAIVDGTWDAGTAKEVFGDGYACAKLPTFTGADGNTYQLGGFGGNKLLGVKPQTDDIKLAVCDAAALYLSSEQVQINRFNAVGWGPSNIAAKADPAVQADEALVALGEQLNYMIPQGQYPGDYWTLATSLGDDVISGKLTTSTSDDDLMKALQTFQDTCIGYAK